MSAALQSPPPLPHQRQEASAAIIANVVAHGRDIERRWGIGLLPRLVPIEWMERFRVQQRQFDAACFEFDHDGIRKHGEAMLRAYAKLEEVAAASGQYPAAPEQWEFTLPNGELVVLVRDRAELGQVDLRGRKAQVWSLEEIAEIVSRFPELSKAKEAFPGAEVVRFVPNPDAARTINDSLEGLPF